MNHSSNFISALLVLLLILTTLAGTIDRIQTLDMSPPRPPAGSCTDRKERDDEPVSFTNVSAEAGFAGRGGSFFAWGDYNNDGCTDLLVNGRTLYRNNGPPGYNFTDVSGPANLSGGVSNGVWGDYDNDGYLDIFAGGRADKLYHNKGDGTFEDVTSAAGMDVDDSPTTAAAWGDHDRDGDLDLYITNGEDWNDGNYIHYPDRFYRNDGDGTFTDVTVAAGMDTTSSPDYGRGVIWGDFDNDGWQDIYVSNYRIRANYLWYNNRDGTFVNRAGELGVKGVGRNVNGQAGGNYYGHTIGSSWADMNNNGRLDLFVSNLVHKDPDRGKFCDDSKLYVNNGPLTWDFTDVRADSGIPIKPVGGTEGGYYDDENFANAVFADYDNDGDMDLWITQVYNHYWMYAYLYRNDGDMTFTNMAHDLDLDVVDTYAGAWADYDNDGDMDLVTAGRTTRGHPVRIRLFRNGGNDNHWLKLAVKDGPGPAVGAQVRVHTDSGICLKQVETGVGSHSSQNDMVLHFGLGSDTSVNMIEITYNDGTVQLLEDVNADRTLTVNKPVDVPSIIDLSAGVTDVDEGVPVTLAIDTDRACPVSWDIDNDGRYDLNVTSADSPRHPFDMAGHYIVRATAWREDGTGGCTATIKIDVHNRAPVAVLTGDDHGLEDHPLSFSSTDSLDSEHDLERMMYLVDFGDGSDTGWVNHTGYHHTYPEEGTYTVELTICDDDGEKDSDTLVVEISNMRPEPGISAVTETMEDDEVLFEGHCNDTLSDAGHILYGWNFGDGDKINFGTINRTSHIYTERGVYDVTLTVKDRHGTVNSTVHTINVSNAAPTCLAPEALSGVEDTPLLLYADGSDTPSDDAGLMYRWDFGDGRYTSWHVIPNVEHTYTQAGNYPAVVTVRDDDMDTNEKNVNVTVENVPPEPVLSVTGSNIFEDDEVVFTASGTDTDSDEDDLLFYMDFGDGNVTAWQEDTSFDHVYNRSGSYTVTLVVRDNSNDTTNVSETILVENVPPQAGFFYSPRRNIDKATPVTFDARYTTDSPSDLMELNYTWTLGKERRTYGKVVRYTFLESGKQTVELNVRDDDGFESTFRASLTVSNTAPEAIINTSASRVGTGEKVAFDARGSLDTPGDMEGLEYEWTIEDTRTNGILVEHVFSKAGVYTVRLLVSDQDGDSGEASLRITVTGDGADGDEGKAQAGMQVWIGLAVAVLVVLFIGTLMVILMRRRKIGEGRRTGKNGGDTRYAFHGPGDAGNETGTPEDAGDPTADTSGSTVEIGIPPLLTTESLNEDGPENDENDGNETGPPIEGRDAHGIHGLPPLALPPLSGPRAEDEEPDAKAITALPPASANDGTIGETVGTDNAAPSPESDEANEGNKTVASEEPKDTVVNSRKGNLQNTLKETADRPTVKRMARKVVRKKAG